MEHHGVAVVPLYPRRRPQLEYTTLDEATPLGLLVAEVDEAGTVPELRAAVGKFVERVGSSPRSRRRSVGLGEEVRLRGQGVVGSGLELEGELIQLCAFTSAEPRRSMIIGRPSRRRRY